MPLEEKDGLVVTQYHAKAVEKIGLVKMDFLGLTNNSVIDDTLGLIKERYNEDIDLENLDLTDKKVYDMMGVATASRSSRWRARVCAICCAK